MQLTLLYQVLLQREEEFLLSHFYFDIEPHNEVTTVKRTQLCIFNHRNTYSMVTKVKYILSYGAPFVK